MSSTSGDGQVGNSRKLHRADPAGRRYGDAVDVDRAADLYAQGWTLRQIGAELGVRWSTVSQQLRSADVTMRGGPPFKPSRVVATTAVPCLSAMRRVESDAERLKGDTLSMPIDDNRPTTSSHGSTVSLG